MDIIFFINLICPIRVFFVNHLLASILLVYYCLGMLLFEPHYFLPSLILRVLLVDIE